jgi:6,7-dimethyl-8-ribityllumazine synthase
VLTTDTLEQALARAAMDRTNKGKPPSRRS